MDDELKHAAIEICFYNIKIFGNKRNIYWAVILIVLFIMLLAKEVTF